MKNIHKGKIAKLITESLEYKQIGDLVKSESTLNKVLKIDPNNFIALNNLGNINSAKNDCLDFMQSEAIIKNSSFQKCSDKGISIGENSNIQILDSTFSENNIAIESKDRSFVEIKNSNLNNNELVFSAYKKNWKYNGGGIIQSKDNLILNNLKNLSKDKFSSITIN